MDKIIRPLSEGSLSPIQSFWICFVFDPLNSFLTLENEITLYLFFAGTDGTSVMRNVPITPQTFYTAFYQNSKETDDDI